jgi:hypothetical protein
VPQPPLPKIPSNRNLASPKNEIVNEKPKTFADIVKQPKHVKKEETHQKQETQQKQEKQEEEWRPTTPPYSPEDFLPTKDDVWHE